MKTTKNTQKKTSSSPWLQRLEHIISLIVAMMMIIGIAIQRDGTLQGKSIEELFSEQTKIVPTTPTSKELKQLGLENATLTLVKEGLWKTRDSLLIASTECYNEGIMGFGGNTPLLIRLVKRADKKLYIQNVVGRKNNETPGFWRRVVRKHFLENWNELSTEEALNKSVDAISNATYTSKAIIENIHATLPHLDTQKIETATTSSFSLDIKSIIVLLTLGFGLLCAYRLKGKTWRWIQLLLNIVVLGYWAGTFISLQLLVGWASQGIHWTGALTLVIIVALAIFLPFIGKKNYYCNHVCPFGAAQEALGRLTKKKMRLSNKVNKILKYSRRVITLTLFVTLWLGAGFDIIHYEPFSFFLFNQAGIVVMVLAIVFLFLSLFIARPYCRFVCPTGQWLSWSQKLKK